MSERHPADEPEPTMQCEYVFDKDSARWVAQRRESSPEIELG